jgi:hypothetical protein
MKLKKITLLLFIPLFLAALDSFSQCEPMTPEQCPDPENNGQICPDSLAMAFIGELYSQVATIKPPATFMLPDSSVINLAFVKLMEVGNLPEGFTWQSNAQNNEFIAGEYYCVLMEGTPDSAGEYPLRVVVDVYVVVIPGFPPIKVATAIDSTSLRLVVVDNSGIKGNDKASFFIRQNNPNPFQDETRILYYSENAGPATFEVYSLLGKRLHAEQLNAGIGENFIVFDGRKFPPGSYFYILRFKGYQTTGMMIRTE